MSEPASVRPAGAARNNRLATPLEGAAIVVVDDDRDIRAMMTRVLSAAGATVTAVGNAAHAKQVLHRGDFHAAVLDWNLGDLTGDALIDYLELPEATLRERVVIITGSFTNSGDHYNAHRAPRNAYGVAHRLVTKPFRPHDLVEILAAIGRPPQ